MIQLTEEDFEIARKTVDDIIDNTNVAEIKEKLYNITQNYHDNGKREFLIFLNGLFGNILMNELTWRCDEAEERALEARRVTKELNNR